MTGLLVVAAGGLAREVLALERALGRYRWIRVLDDDRATWGSQLDGEPVVGGLDLVTEYDDHDILVCAGKGTARRSIVERLTVYGVTRDRYTTAVHPSVDVPADCTVGAGSIVLAQAALTTNVQLGEHVVVMPNVTLTHDDVVEDYATLCAGVSLGGGVRIGAAAYIGMNASVRQQLSVGAGATLGMGAALVEDLPSSEVWAGVPAARLRVPLRREA